MTVNGGKTSYLITAGNGTMDAEVYLNNIGVRKQSESGTVTTNNDSNTNTTNNNNAEANQITNNNQTEEEQQPIENEVQENTSQENILN